MKQIKIILNSGKEITFAADDNFSFDQCMDTSTYHAPNKMEYNFKREEVAAKIVTPLVQCKGCGSWVVPEVHTAIYGSKKHFTMPQCPMCNETFY